VGVPAYVSAALAGRDALLLDTRTGHYFVLNQVGTRIWGLLVEGRSLSEAHRVLVDEYDADPTRLERDLLELVERLLGSELLEVRPLPAGDTRRGE
jgi:hypothetical protein